MLRREYNHFLRPSRGASSVELDARLHDAPSTTERALRTIRWTMNTPCTEGASDRTKPRQKRGSGKIIISQFVPHGFTVTQNFVDFF